ncbi:hypothetical protein EDD36DRAFT_243620 [Exophiala viscosa]|uniref:Uncharacterized protein n=1 Tax=Exophiala viscosa TaxID=2486360 RepID=A0AAN6DV58_9EURO|nr:hypothetical protein EDD36DRAFT_243620 [Exophiala viscosa]
MILSSFVTYLCILLIYDITSVASASIPQQFLAHGTTQQDAQQSLDLVGGPVLRNATFADAWAIVDIVDAAFSPSAPTRYRYQFKDKYPQEHRQCMYEAYTEVFDPECIYVQVIQLPDHEDPVSVAVWVDAKKYPFSDTQGWNVRSGMY